MAKQAPAWAHARPPMPQPSVLHFVNRASPGPARCGVELIDELAERLAAVGLVLAPVALADADLHDLAPRRSSRWNDGIDHEQCADL